MTAQDLVTLIGWGSPIGLGVFLLTGTLALYYLAKTATIDMGKRKKD